METYMKFLDYIQGSEEWLSLRKDKVTGTDAASILDMSPFKNVNKLWEEKLGIRSPDKPNQAMQHGTINEPIARDLLIKEKGIHFDPIVALHDSETWAMASLDGYNVENNVICEIKCPFKLEGHELALQGEIKEYYIPQIQHGLWVTGAKLCYFVSYMPDHEKSLVIIEILPDLEFIEKMIPKLHEFYVCMCTFMPPAWQFKEKKKSM